MYLYHFTAHATVVRQIWCDQDGTLRGEEAFVWVADSIILVIPDFQEED